ncbi:MAG: hypothetical protein CMK33_02250 [Porticoccaceae bacterium]|nr:hypothetical protein [Porticoccaceae bacterium]
MRAHDLQPVPFDGFRRVSSWLAEHRYRSTATRLFEAAAFPESWNIGLPGCLDGPMRVNDDGVLWLADERVFMRAVIGLGTPVLGFCLDPAGVAAPRVWRPSDRVSGRRQRRDIQDAGCG